MPPYDKQKSQSLSLKEETNGRNATVVISPFELAFELNNYS